jgi:hypothetical protein
MKVAENKSMAELSIPIYLKILKLLFLSCKAAEYILTWFIQIFIQHNFQRKQKLKTILNPSVHVQNIRTYLFYYISRRKVHNINSFKKNAVQKIHSYVNHNQKAHFLSLLAKKSNPTLEITSILFNRSFLPPGSPLSIV